MCLEKYTGDCKEPVEPLEKKLTRFHFIDFRKAIHKIKKIVGAVIYLYIYEVKYDKHLVDFKSTEETVLLL